LCDNPRPPIPLGIQDEIVWKPGRWGSVISQDPTQSWGQPFP
jgi:hypothetical protein